MTSADMIPAALPADVRERARVVALELLRRRRKGYRALNNVARLATFYQRHIENRPLHLEEILDFARRLTEGKEAA